MMHLQTVTDILNDIAPLRYAEPWDNVGLLWGDTAQSVTRVLMAVDATPAVLAEAAAAEVHLLVAYHPPLFKAVKRIDATSPLFAAARGGFALYSPHTALDATPGGTNDVLADAAGLTARVPLVAATSAAPDMKLVVFVPKTHVDTLCDALFAAGAGRMGAYSRCSFQLAGQGSFRPDAEAQPYLGQLLEQTVVAEVRVELVVPRKALGGILAALHKHHPYQTPAFDLFSRAAVPQAFGQGRIGDLPDAHLCDAAALAARLKVAMGARNAMVATPRGVAADKRLRRVAVQAGAGDSMLEAAKSRGADVFVTGELRHHTVLSAVAQGITVITLTHDDSERAALRPYAEQLRKHAPELDVQLSGEDRSPWLCA